MDMDKSRTQISRVCDRIIRSVLGACLYFKLVLQALLAFCLTCKTEKLAIPCVRNENVDWSRVKDRLVQNCIPPSLSLDSETAVAFLDKAFSHHFYTAE